MPEIRVSVISKSVGGSIVSPVCSNAVRFCQIAGKETLSDIDLFHIERLGFDIIIDYRAPDDKIDMAA